eukprot:snap_masked-scaffold_7-processed-gene-13.36-mRNA-1 protein AED:1.00 eAED:1.00 QI:0/0/0/0/1/1/2/0/71
MNILEPDSGQCCCTITCFVLIEKYILIIPVKSYQFENHFEDRDDETFLTGVAMTSGIITRNNFSDPFVLGS